MPEKVKLEKLDDKENDKIHILAKNAGYDGVQTNKLLNKIEKYTPDFLDAGRFINRGFKLDKVNKILALADKEGIEKLKEVNSYIKLGRNSKPKKINDRISQFTRFVTKYEHGLKEIVNRKWNAKGIEIPLEGGGKKLMTFKDEEEFNKWKEADVENVSKHIEHDKGEVVEWSRYKKFKEALG